MSAEPSVSSSPLPPAVILGGGANALSVARSLSRAGVRVYALNEPRELIRYSRAARFIDRPHRGDLKAEWLAFLLGPDAEFLRGAVLLSCSDEAIELMIENREALAARYVLDDSNPTAQQCMLNKLRTYEAARAAGVPTPKFWVVETADDVAALRGELVFPLLVKPLLSHEFESRFGKKFLVARGFEELRAAWAAVTDARVRCMLVEMIPGADNLSCSYYTYMDAAGEPCFDFTKRNLRRTPVNMGRCCYHITDAVAGVKEHSLKLFRQVGVRGLAHVEYKLDERDGQLKLIECNARFTAANPLVAASGFDLARFVYDRLTGRPGRALVTYRLGMRMWDPVQDFKSYLELRRRGEMSFPRWVRSVCHRQMLTNFQWTDPLPALMGIALEVREIARRRASWLRAKFTRNTAAPAPRPVAREEIPEIEIAESVSSAE